MALPPAATAAKIALTLATDKRTWKVIGVIIAAALIPFIIVIVAILGMWSGAAHHNNAALDLTFNGGNIPASMPAEYRVHITEMRAAFAALDSAVEAIGREAEWEGELDMIRVKSVFYALYFGDDNLRLRASEARAFALLFIRYETRTRPCTSSGCHDDDDDCYEEYLVAIPLADLQIVYANVAAHIGRALTIEDKTNINEIYLRVTRGDFSVDFGAIDKYGGANNTHALIRELTADDDSPAPTGGLGSPVRTAWRPLVTSEFGERVHPITRARDFHTGIDFGVATSTEILAAADGVVLFTRASATGYGIHLAINHGGGIVTLYAHNSRNLVGEGQRVSRGDVIALSGSTGNSTGPHLHYEVIVDGVPQNPRPFLP